MKKNSILVIIVSYNAMQWAERCLDSLNNTSVPCDVLIVDNGSVDGTQSFVREKYGNVELIETGVNLGFGRANNIGLKKAIDEGYDYVYLLNQDAWVMPDTFEKLITISKSNPDYGILSPFQMNADMYHIDRNFIKTVIAWDSNPDIGSDMYNQKYNEVYSVPLVMAAHWFMTRECILKVGGFSPSFPHYSEDYNYLDRVYYRKMKVGIIPTLRVVHDRAYREDTFEKKMYLLYTVFVRDLSNPMSSVKRSFVFVSYVAFREMLKFKSFRPILNWMKSLLCIRSILGNRKISMSTECAFL